jgi:hypothetical protein
VLVANVPRINLLSFIFGELQLSVRIKIKGLALLEVLQGEGGDRD